MNDLHYEQWTYRDLLYYWCYLLVSNMCTEIVLYFAALKARQEQGRQLSK